MTAIWLVLAAALASFGSWRVLSALHALRGREGASVSVRRQTALGLISLAVALALAGVAVHEGPTNNAPEGSGVLFRLDSPPSGNPALRDNAERLAITPAGIPAAVYAVRVGRVEAGDRLRALSTVTVTKCHHTDYDPTQRAQTGCVGTPHYHYNPVSVTSELKLVPDHTGHPDLSAQGISLGDARHISCTNLLHHCTIVNVGKSTVTSAPSGRQWLVLEMSARSPDASECPTGRQPDGCEVMAVETQKGTAMYGIKSWGSPTIATPIHSSRLRVRELPIVDDNDPRGADRRVLYSVSLTGPGEVSKLLGDQFVAISRFSVDEHESGYAPLISGYLVLARRPDAISGRYLSSGSYSDVRTGNTGENCSGTCSYTKAAAATQILPCDVAAGRRFVNLVVDASRDIAAPTSDVQVLGDGEMLVAPYFDGGTDSRAAGRCRKHH